MQYDNNLREKKIKKFGSQKAFIQKVHLEKRVSSYNQGRLIFGSIRYTSLFPGPNSPSDAKNKHHMVQTEVCME